jgi:hypothetical protein
MKLLFWPLFLFSWAESRMLRKRYEYFWCIKLLGTLTGLLIIPTVYYTYTGALGVSADWFNITIFFLAAAATFLLETRLFKKEDLLGLPNFLALLLLWSLAAAFVIFTFWPPSIPLFQDPVTLQYGI